MGQCPFKPLVEKSKMSLLMTFFFKKRSWLDGLYERSYKMKTGRVKMPGLDLHIINETKEIKKVLVDEVKEYPKSDFLHTLLEPLLGNSIFTTNGETWEKQRDLMRPSFEMTRINKVFELMNSSVQDLLLELGNLPKDKYIDIDKHMTYVTADVIFRTIMSKKLDKEDANKIIEAFEIFQEETTKTAIRKFFFVPKFISIILGENKRIKAGEIIRKSLSDIIKPRYELAAQNVDLETTDILSSLLKVKDADTNEMFSFEEILDQIAMLFLAGHETSASALTSSFYLLGLYPEEQEKLYKEIMQVTNGEEINISHIRQFKSLSNFFKETLRLYPPVGFLPRQSTENKTIRNKEIKEGAGVVVSPWLMHRNENYWKNPDDFNPNRFNEKNERYSYMPYGAGERICIGQGFANQEAMIILSNIIKNYKIELKKDFKPDLVGRLTIRSANGMPVKLHKRV